jgi:hypothetical protein
MTGPKEPAPRLPQEGDWIRLTGTMIKKETIQPPPPPPTVLYLFEEVSAVVELRSPLGDVLTNVGAFNDYHGEGTATASGVEETEKYIVANALSADGDGVYVAVVEVREYLYLRPSLGNDKGSFHDKEFRQMERVARHIPGAPPLPETKRRDVWTSRKGWLIDEPGKAGQSTSGGSNEKE